MQKSTEQKLKNRMRRVNQVATSGAKTSSKKPIIIALIVFLALAVLGTIFYFFILPKLQPTTPESTSATPIPEASEPLTPSDSSNSIEESSDKTSSADTTSIDISESSVSTETEVAHVYSTITGEPIASEDVNSHPTFCVQIPNGADGARDQVGLNSAKIIFEAIAEAGITRFAAIFQDPPAIIGPIRSLRIYYLDWDTPFDCTIVHAGGAADAIAAVRSGGYRDLTENYAHMFRSSAYWPSGQQTNRMWNNLFTTASGLSEYNASKGYHSSDIKSFPRLLPETAKRDLIDRQAVNPLRIDTPATGDTNALIPKVGQVSFRFGYSPNFNPIFTYNSATNSYDRSYQTGSAHTVFDCVSEDSCTSVQLSPKVVIGMIVQEKRALYDNYHEDISSIGAGDAYVFQNGDVIAGTWEKSSAASQIIFRDESGQEISLVPGQTWISAIPNYGAVEY